MNILENVKVGDKLLVRQCYEDDEIETVIRVTKTLAITMYHRFRIKDGLSIPTVKWMNARAIPATSEDIERFKKEHIRINNIEFCQNTDFEELTDGQLERIINIIKG